MSMLLHLVSLPMRGSAQYTQFRIEYSVLKSEDCSCFALLEPISAAQGCQSVSLRNEVFPHKKAFFIQRLESSQTAQTTAREMNFARGRTYIRYIRLLGGYFFETLIE